MGAARAAWSAKRGHRHCHSASLTKGRGGGMGEVLARVAAKTRRQCPMSEPSTRDVVHAQLPHVTASATPTHSLPSGYTK